MVKQKYATAMAFAGIGLTAIGTMKTAEGLTFWLLALSVLSIEVAAIMEAFFTED